MVSLPANITDPTYNKATFKRLSGDNFLMRFIKDEADLPFMRVLFLIQLTVIPVAILLFTPLLKGWAWWAVALPYFYWSQFKLKGSFGLLLHCFCHRKIFKPAYKWMYHYVLRFVSPFFGHLGESYQSHHMGMHHVEDNMPDDSSSTMRYQRDNVGHFLIYWLRFMFLGWKETFDYLFSKKLKRFYVPLSWSEALFIIACIVLCFVNLKATILVFIVPFVFARLVMMLGNWTQHAFVDPQAPDDQLASTFICINTKYNHKCWNDGYHALHHLRQGAHYTEYPVLFKQMLPKFIEKKTLIFNGVHYLHLFIWLMTKRYDKMAAHLVNIDNMFASEQEVIGLLKLRTMKFDLEAFSVRKQEIKVSVAG